MTVPVPRAACPVPARAHIQRRQRRRQRRRRRRRRRSLEDPHARTLMHVVITACAARNICVLFALPVVRQAMRGAPMPPGPSAVALEPACRVASCRITGRHAVVAAGARLFPRHTRISRSGTMVRSGKMVRSGEKARSGKMVTRISRSGNEMGPTSRLGTMAHEARETRAHVVLI